MGFTRHHYVTSETQLDVRLAFNIELDMKHHLCRPITESVGGPRELQMNGFFGSVLQCEAPGSVLVRRESSSCGGEVILVRWRRAREISRHVVSVMQGDPSSFRHGHGWFSKRDCCFRNFATSREGDSNLRQEVLRVHQPRMENRMLGVYRFADPPRHPGGILIWGHSRTLLDMSVGSRKCNPSFLCSITAALIFGSRNDFL